jgi:hypothetical protein
MNNNVGNEIRSYIALSGQTLQNIVKILNENRPQEEQTTPQNISNKLSRGTLKYSEAKEIANAIGFTIEWKKP